MTTTLKNKQETAPFFVNTTTLAGVLSRGEANGVVQPIFITNELGQFLICIEPSNEYLLKQLDELQDGAFVMVEASIKQLDSGHYLFAQSFNRHIAAATGVVIRVDEPREHNGKHVLNFAVSQSVSKDDPGVIINCSYWYKDSTAIANKVKKGASVTVSGSLKPGSYTKDGVEVPTLGIDVQHIATPRGSGFSNGIMPMVVPGGKGTPVTVTAPVAGQEIDF